MEYIPCCVSDTLLVHTICFLNVLFEIISCPIRGGKIVVMANEKLSDRNEHIMKLSISILVATIFCVVEVERCDLSMNLEQSETMKL